MTELMQKITSGPEKSKIFLEFTEIEFPQNFKYDNAKHIDYFYFFEKNFL